jgi:hypothetical protein
LFRGERIDTFFKEAVAADPSLQHLSITPRFTFGPDVFHPDAGVWWDATTPGEWGDHVKKYTDSSAAASHSSTEASDGFETASRGVGAAPWGKVARGS